MRQPGSWVTQGGSEYRVRVDGNVDQRPLAQRSPATICPECQAAMHRIQTDPDDGVLFQCPECFREETY